MFRQSRHWTKARHFLLPWRLGTGFWGVSQPLTSTFARQQGRDNPGVRVGLFSKRNPDRFSSSHFFDDTVTDSYIETWETRGYTGQKDGTPPPKRPRSHTSRCASRQGGGKSGRPPSRTKLVVNTIKLYHDCVSLGRFNQHADCVSQVFSNLVTDG